ncbi:hypothetical protein AMJ40_02850 [candidate division TA06 bacterium DG_26]|uniref:BPL/LPL catalytic domain-containing protein n=1 Tax=candidate division TA06 bacterium DG_26 TaxID=1703771 RepID=A0A0S7WKM2_UNCT6|nr:MAG: hypothetical protein AMJ40_02850 [candidate division TA06 bacterium DG_26]
MYLLNLDKLPGQQSMLIFHALARIGVEALVIVSPDTPLVSIGYFQNAEAEVDLDFCSRSGLPVMRREVGGGATYLDGNQIFYQVIWNRENRKFPKKVRDIFEFLSVPACKTYEEFGIPAQFRAENDIVTTTGKKIAGEGGGDIGQCMAFVGGILLDFDYGTMARVLKVPDEKFRDKVFKSMEDNLTTMRRELGQVPPRQEIKKVLTREFGKILDSLEPIDLDESVVRKMLELERWFTDPKFLHLKRPKLPSGVKIREGVEILYGLHKARGGLIRTAEEIQERRINAISISGDFNLYPKDSLQILETHLERVKLEESALTDSLGDFYEQHEVQSPGVTPEDFTKTILEAKED